MMRLTDLREMLRYVPRFRDKVFVIAADGAVVEDDNFPNLLLDLALLRSLSVRVAVVHGAGHQIRRLAEQTGLRPSNIDGTGITDPATLQMALTAANRVSHEWLEGLATHDLRG
ncbi:MAG TPA: amino-acid N-acetyltransferase, partial [Gemmataceae bacterium]|nr:amino-acid N-acetyltransferase [Gemmataceae bacterium]